MRTLHVYVDLYALYTVHVYRLYTWNYSGALVVRSFSCVIATTHAERCNHDDEQEDPNKDPLCDDHAEAELPE